ncbi:Alpha-1,4-glucan:maltose-1-phosphate maltosyltransferase 1 [Kocuria varians]|uniref:Alpha-1,4-glucan:maltose-1-phosphate maltosyltransferase n=2 Tax=Kocuria varians TaxID=1272 RepID=A0A7D7PYT8_KOCVA|nr:Alpha-1,4-glucan:maltose-1-phosphate maltosyltransferase 1 [Kocuria varians]
MSQQNSQPHGRRPSHDPAPDAHAGDAHPDVGSRLTPPVPATGVPDVAPSVSSADVAPHASAVTAADDSHVVARESHGTGNGRTVPEPGVTPEPRRTEIQGTEPQDPEDDPMDFPSADLVYGRIPVTDVSPVIEGGRFPATAIPGEDIRVGATVFREGHDSLGVTAVLYDPRGRETQRRRMRLVATGTDRYEAVVRPESEGRWSFAVEGWSDLYDTWHHAAEIKLGVGQDVELMFQEAALLFDAASKESERSSEEVRAFEEASEAMTDTSRTPEERWQIATSEQILRYVEDRPLRDLVTTSARYPVEVEREAAGRGAWYEFFPRSEGATYDPESGTWTSGNFRTATPALDRAARMGFDVAYLPPIHPIGRNHRKGPDNTLTAGPQDPGSPWAIGGPEGGHDAIHPDLGTFEDFDAFVAHAQGLGLEVALDLALQASPDHPWVQEHPQWFTTRADGSIAYAENPPKKYQDIYPLNFDNDPQGLAAEVLRIVELWIGHGVDIFRVDNPHTKPLWFWEWLIARVREKHPDTVFLAEAFTRPAMMRGLAKAGFEQSYSYFTWRNTKEEIEEYFEEISHETSGFYRPNFFVNTPDILTEYLQFGGPAAFKVRAVLAATASPLWGLYAGFELFEHVARPGAEEYIDNEKFQLRPRDFDGALERGESLAPYVTRLNQIRRDHPALGDLQNLTVQATSDDAVVAYSKTKTVEHGGVEVRDTVIVVVNTDPHATREATVWLDLDSLDLRDEDFNEDGSFWVDDLISGASWKWGSHNYVRLDPYVEPAHVLSIRRDVK